MRPPWRAAASFRPARPSCASSPEIAFELGRDLPARDAPYGPAEIDAIGSARLALEILGCRYTAPEHAYLSELLADHMLNAGLVLGPQIASPGRRPSPP